MGPLDHFMASDDPDAVRYRAARDAYRESGFTDNDALEESRAALWATADRVLPRSFELAEQMRQEGRE